MDFLHIFVKVGFVQQIELGLRINHTTELHFEGTQDIIIKRLNSKSPIQNNPISTKAKTIQQIQNQYKLNQK